MAKKMMMGEMKTKEIKTKKAKVPVSMKLPSRGASKPSGGGKKGY